MPEQLALEQRFGQRRAVDGDEGLAATRREVVDRARHQLLAGAGLALDEHRGADRRHVLDLDEHLLDGRRFADDAGALLQPAALDQPAHRGGDLDGVGRLGEERRQAELARQPFGVGLRSLDQTERGDGAVAGDGHDPRPRGLVQPAGDDQAVGLARADRRPHLVQRGRELGHEPRPLEVGVDADRLLEVLGGDDDAISHLGPPCVGRRARCSSRSPAPLRARESRQAHAVRL